MASGYLITGAGFSLLFILILIWFCRSSLRSAATAFVVVGLAFGWGALQSILCPTQPDSWLGREVTASGVVTNVYLNAKSATVIATLSDALVDGGKHRCNVRVELRVGVHLAASVTAGEPIEVKGVLSELPPPFKALPGGQKAKPPILFQPKTYELLGQLNRSTSEKESRWLLWRDKWLGATSITPNVSSENRALAGSIVFGSSGINQGVKQAFLSAGLMHVLAASGANILLIEIALEHTLYPIWRRVRLPYRVWVVTLVSITWVFTAMCGGQPSIIRAAVMSTYRLFGRAFGRESSLRTSLSIAAITMAILQPAAMLSPSAWLSFVATAALAHGLTAPIGMGNHRQDSNGFVQSKLQRWAWKGATKVLGVIRATLWIEVWVTPLVLWLFAQVTPYSVVSNVICEPLLGVLLPFVVFWMGMCILAHATHYLVSSALMVGFVVQGMLQLLQGIVNAVARFPGALIHSPVISTWVIVAYYGLIIIGFWAFGRWRRRESTI